MIIQATVSATSLLQPPSPPLPSYPFHGSPSPLLLSPSPPPASPPRSPPVSSFQAYTSTPGSLAVLDVPANTSIVLIFGSLVPPSPAYAVTSALVAPDNQLPSLARGPDVKNFTGNNDFIAQNVVLYAQQWVPGYAGAIAIQVGAGRGGVGIDRAVFISAEG